MVKILIVCTSNDKLGDSGTTTGSWAEEVAAPFYVFKEAGYDVTIVSIKGGEVPFDDASLNAPFLTKEAEKFLLDDAAMKLVTESAKLDDVAADVSSYDAIFLPGGHGVCWDLPDNATLKKTLTDMWESGKVVSAVCHGPAGLVNAVDKEGKPLVAGRKVTGFSNEEEVAVGKDNLVPFLLEDKLKELGGKYSKGEKAWTPYAVRDGRLATGQNPQSSAAVAKLVVEALKEQAEGANASATSAAI